MTDLNVPEQAQLTMTIVLENISEPQRLAIEDMLAYWRESNRGYSRWMAFFVDGDGNFRPKITVNGEPPKHQTEIEPGHFWTGKEPWRGEYRMDFDAIAWKLRKPAADQDGKPHA